MSSCWLSYENFLNISNKRPAKKLNWAWFSFKIKFITSLSECDGEVGRVVNSESQGCGFYPHMGQILVDLFKFFFFHTFIKFNIHKVLVEASL